VGRLQSRDRTTSTTSTCDIPDKLYFKIGEVAELVGVETHVLRYWEKEIPFIRPSKTPSNQRRYRRKDVEVFREIKRLLHNERYTLAGARRRLLGGERHQEAEAPAEMEAEVTPVDQRPLVTATAAPVVPPAARQVAPQARPTPQPAATTTATRQLPLGFSRPAEPEKLERLKHGLKELIRLSGEEP